MKMILALLYLVLADDAFRGARENTKAFATSPETPTEYDALRFSIIRLQAITSSRDLLRPWMHGMGGLGGLAGLMGGMMAHGHAGMKGGSEAGTGPGASGDMGGLDGKLGGEAGKKSSLLEQPGPGGPPMGGMPGMPPGLGGIGGMEQSVGSGFVVHVDEDGPLIVTNAHVVSDAPALAIQVPAAGQEQYEARVVLVNHDMDIALVKIASEEEVEKLTTNMGENKLEPVSLYNGTAKVGMTAVAMGFPLGMTSVKVSTGVLSGHETVGDFIVYQHTSPISPGNSGGPLFVEGTKQVLGINFATAAGAVSQQNNFAIPSWRVQQMLTAYHKSTSTDAATDGDGEKPSKSSKKSKAAKKAAGPAEKTEDGEQLDASADLMGLFQSMGMSLMSKTDFSKEEIQKLEDPAEKIAEYGVYNREECLKDRGECEFKVPKLNAEMTIGTDHLYKLYGCPSGILVSRVENTSYLAKADPPIGPKTFITKINGVQLDRFGMGHAPDYFNDPIGFADLLFSRTDLSEQATMETCSCGETKKHTVSLRWSPEMTAPVPFIDEPVFAHLDYEQFGEVTITPLTMNVAAQLMQMGRVDLIAYLVDPNPSAALVITDVEQGSDTNVLPGSIVAKVNGEAVANLKELRTVFTDVKDVKVTCGMQTSLPAGAGVNPLEALLGGMHAPATHKMKAQVKHKTGDMMAAWVVETQDGEEIVQGYAETLEQQSTMVAEGVRPMTPGVKSAIEAKASKDKKLGESEAEPAASDEEGQGEEGSGQGMDLLGLFNLMGGGKKEGEAKEGEGDTAKGKSEKATAEDAEEDASSSTKSKKKKHHKHAEAEEAEEEEEEEATLPKKKKKAVAEETEEEEAPLPKKKKAAVEDEAEDEEPATHSKKANRSKPKHDDDMSEESEDESMAFNTVKNTELGEGTLADALRILKSIPTHARSDARRMAFVELLAKVPVKAVEERKGVRRGGARF